MFAVRDAADSGCDGTDGLELPQVEPLVELGALQLLPKLPGIDTELGGTESRLIEPVEVEQP